ncbi:MAG: hypothetical protein KKA84_15270 [Bacteroidetes bacterium]|nr:hypothetical protein [Bacteroidota bacterium]
MTMQLLDRSNYLKGLLILIRKDNLITTEERDLVLECGVSLGFEKRFCETAIDELLENEYLLDTPPVFSNNDLAESFLKDAVKVALADKKMHLFELQWLIETAALNNLPERIVDDLLRYYISDNSIKADREKMEYEKMMIE